MQDTREAELARKAKVLGGKVADRLKHARQAVGRSEDRIAMGMATVERSKAAIERTQAAIDRETMQKQQGHDWPPRL